jgi:hypothetical protein
MMNRGVFVYREGKEIKEEASFQFIFLHIVFKVFL